MSDPIFVGKLSVATTGMTPYAKKNTPEKEGVFAAGRFFGIATGLKNVTNADGTTGIAIRGDFEAECYKPDPETGEIQVYKSSVLYLPGSMQDSLVSVFQQDNPPSSVKFALEVGVIKAANPQGYSWVGKSLIPQSAADPLDDLRKALVRTSPPKNLTKQEEKAA